MGLRTYVLHECENNACYIPYATMGKKNNRLSRVFCFFVPQNIIECNSYKWKFYVCSLTNIEKASV